MSVEKIVQNCRRSFAAGQTRDLNFRENQLRSLAVLYEENESKFLAALAKDLRKSTAESDLSELIAIRNELRLALAQFKDWSRPETVSKTVLANILDVPQIYKDPYGLVLIIGSWNYPLRLIFVPLIGAIAAGNCVVIKPSELATATSQLIADLVPKYLDNDCYRVVTGGVEETTELLRERFDYIFFTGSTSVGRIVRDAANKHLTPCTLELGGKCPVYLDDTADIETATRRILWGKLFNGGQTCIAPDYLMCTPATEAKFLAAARQIVAEFYGRDPRTSTDFCRIVNKRHLLRIRSLLDGVRATIGGVIDEDELYVSPTIVAGVKSTDRLMREEIFGPVLPIINMNDASEAIAFINGREKPLALYVFSDDRKVIDRFLQETSSGGATINDTLVHIAAGCLPFGGVGSSGTGSYQGKATFDTFTHRKSVLRKDLSWLGERAGSVRYPPYNATKWKVLRLLMRESACKYRKFLPLLVAFIFGIVSCILYRIMIQN